MDMYNPISKLLALKMLQQNDGMMTTLRTISQLLQQQKPRSEHLPIINHLQIPPLQLQSTFPLSPRTTINFNYRDLKMPIINKLQQPIPQKPELMKLERANAPTESKLENISKDIKSKDQELPTSSEIISQEQIFEKSRMSKKM